MNCVGEGFGRLAPYNSLGLKACLSRPLRLGSELGESISLSASGALALSFTSLPTTLRFASTSSPPMASVFCALPFAGRPRLLACTVSSRAWELGGGAAFSCAALRPRFLGRDSSSASCSLVSGRSLLDASAGAFDAPGGRPRFRF